MVYGDHDCISAVNQYSCCNETVFNSVVVIRHYIYVEEPCETLSALFYYGPKVLVYGDHDCISVVNQYSFERRMLPTIRSIASFLGFICHCCNKTVFNSVVIIQYVIKFTSKSLAKCCLPYFTIDPKCWFTETTTAFQS